MLFKGEKSVRADVPLANKLLRLINIACSVDVVDGG